MRPLEPEERVAELLRVDIPELRCTPTELERPPLDEENVPERVLLERVAAERVAEG